MDMVAVAQHIPAIIASIAGLLAAIALWRKAEADRQKAVIELELKKLEIAERRRALRGNSTS